MYQKNDLYHKNKNNYLFLNNKRKNNLYIFIYNV